MSLKVINKNSDSNKIILLKHDKIVAHSSNK